MIATSSKLRNESEGLRVQVWKRLRNSLGRLPTEEEIAAEIDATKARRSAQGQLFPAGQEAAKSKAAACKRSNAGRIARRARALEEFERVGSRGLTRFELAERIGCQQSSICSTVIDLILSGDVVELATRRNSAAGGAGVVIVLKRFAAIPVLAAESAGDQSINAEGPKDAHRE